MSILKANVSKSLVLRDRVKFWLEDNKSFKNANQTLSYDDDLSRMDSLPAVGGVILISMTTLR